VAGLTTPSLRRLYISVVESVLTLRTSHLSKFIRVAGIIFFAARLSFSRFDLTTSMFAHPHSINGWTRIVTFRTPSEANLGSALSPMLATLEDVFLCISIPPAYNRPLLRNLVHWRNLFEKFRNVKVLRLHHGLETEIADVLRQPTENPSPAQGDLFPLLEKILVYARRPITKDEFVNGLEPFREYAIARQQAGRPVEVLWNMPLDGVPRYYMLPDVGP
jgi:hypothetical protein